MQTNEAFTTVYTGGRDRHIWATDLRSNPESRNQTLVAVESAPVLKMILTPNGKGLWVSTSESNVKYWDISDVDYHVKDYRAAPESGPPPRLQSIQPTPQANPRVVEPELVIRGGPSIKQYRVLNDKRHILTKDTDNRVTLYDVLKAQRVEDLGAMVDFEEEIKRRSQVSWTFFFEEKKMSFFFQKYGFFLGKRDIRLSFNFIPLKMHPIIFLHRWYMCRIGLLWISRREC